VERFSSDAAKLISGDEGQLDSGLDSMSTSRPEVFSLVGDGSAFRSRRKRSQRSAAARLPISPI